MLIQVKPLICQGAPQSNRNNVGGEVNEFTLNNGIKIIHREIKDNPLVSIQCFLYSGGANETEEKAGLAGFTQSLMFKGTKNRNWEELAKEMESMGGNVSSDVASDYSDIGMTVLDSNADRAASILSDLILNPVFSQDEIDKEKANLLAGIKARKDRIFSFSDDIFIKTFYKNHPYSWPESGTESSVKNISKKDIERWHNKYYSSGNMTIIVFGNISLKNTKKICINYFGTIKNADTGSKLKPLKSPKHEAVKRSSDKFQQAFLMIGFAAPSVDSTDYPTLKVINSVLGGRMTGKLFMELREKMSLAYEVSSFYTSRKQLSRYVIYIGLKKENIPSARKRIFEILSDLKENGISDSELKDTRNFIKGTYLLDHQTLARKAWYAGWWQVMGKTYDYDEKYLENLMAVSRNDIKRIANKYFDENSVEVSVTPAK